MAKLANQNSIGHDGELKIQDLTDLTRGQNSENLLLTSAKIEIQDACKKKSRFEIGAKNLTGSVCLVFVRQESQGFQGGQQLLLLLLPRGGEEAPGGAGERAAGRGDPGGRQEGADLVEEEEAGSNLW